MALKILITLVNPVFIFVPLIWYGWIYIFYVYEYIFITLLKYKCSKYRLDIFLYMSDNVDIYI